jgi:hypothetical protein
VAQKPGLTIEMHDPEVARPPRDAARSRNGVDEDLLPAADSRLVPPSLDPLLERVHDLETPELFVRGDVVGQPEGGRPAPR